MNQLFKRVPGASRKRTAAVDRSLPLLDRTNLVDIMRFNEAIDQATAETTARFARELRHSRDLFLAILGHVEVSQCRGSPFIVLVQKR